MHLPEVNVDYGELYRMLFLPIRTKLLLTGIELKVFNYLSNPTSAEEVAQAIFRGLVDFLDSYSLE